MVYTEQIPSEGQKVCLPGWWHGEEKGVALESHGLGYQAQPSNFLAAHMASAR